MTFSIYVPADVLASNKDRPPARAVQTENCICFHAVSIVIDDIFYFIKTEDMYEHVNDHWAAIHHKELTTLTDILHNKTKSMIRCFEINVMQAKSEKSQGILLIWVIMQANLEKFQGISIKWDISWSLTSVMKTVSFRKLLYWVYVYSID